MRTWVREVETVYGKLAHCEILCVSRCFPPPADGVRSEQWRKGRKGEQSRCCTVVVNSYELVSQILTLTRPVTRLWYG